MPLPHICAGAFAAFVINAVSAMQSTRRASGSIEDRKASTLASVGCVLLAAIMFSSVIIDLHGRYSSPTHGNARRSPHIMHMKGLATQAKFPCLLATLLLASTLSGCMTTQAIAPSQRPTTWSQPAVESGLANLHRVTPTLWRSALPDPQ